ncbi:hypothetical protein BDZ89DRAFT_467005 [Hymenopellis radicata]|nr:hypothetical protein BDZ89DRAFT_467005 [Hymenopellis radicata]
MHFSTSFIALTTLVLGALALPSPNVDSDVVTKRETSYGNPDLVVDQGDRWKLNFGSTDGHNNACPGHYICYIGKGGSRHGDESWGNPDDMVDEGDRWRFNYPNSGDGPCGDHYICYYNK